MAGWFKKSLGGGVEASEPTDRIREAWFAARSIQAQQGYHPTDAAVFSYYDVEADEVTVYFSPSAELLARAFDATPCDKPTPAERFGLLAGDAGAMETHFLGFWPRRAGT